MDLQIHKDSIQFIKDHKNELCEEFANIREFPSFPNPSANFMAGSPGAGKTEFSKSFIEEFQKTHSQRKIVRIDADDIRIFIPAYTKHNSVNVQGAASLGVEKILDRVINNKQDFLLDATLANYEKSYSNIFRCLKHDYRVGVIYLYQEPEIAWMYTKYREIKEGRDVSKDVFIDAFLNAYKNAQKLKGIFQDKVELWLVVKDLEQDHADIYYDIENLASLIKMKYNRKILKNLIHE